jgi:hypothetical protein
VHPGCVDALASERRVEIGHVRATHEGERPLDLGSQQLERAVDACLTACCKPVQVGAAQHARARAERESLDDIGAAANAAAEDDFDIAESV